MKPSINAITQALLTKGHQQYGGEAVSQLEHALQCATLAEAHGASNELITACLLHDFGHLLHNLGEDAAQQGIDDRHEYRALAYLRQLFPPAVTEPIRLHVAAKRYLCAVDFHYWSSLSLASRYSLVLQGGKFSGKAATVFIKQPYAELAVQLRLWDDRSKRTVATPDLWHFVPIVATV
ncbi:MAG: phosphonate degradation HD-domain oxygenase [Cyanophyceae cyanobacterium]